MNGVMHTKMAEMTPYEISEPPERAPRQRKQFKDLETYPICFTKRDPEQN